MAIVRAVDAYDVEVLRQGLDLAQEVVGGESALPQRSGSVFDVAAIRTPRPTSRLSRVETSTVSPGSSSSNSSMHSSRVAPSRSTASANPMRADQMGELDEGREQLRCRSRVPDRCEQVRLADAVATVEVEPGRPHPPGWRDAETTPRAAGASNDATKRSTPPRQRTALARLGRIRPVRRRSARRRRPAAAPARRRSRRQTRPGLASRQGDRHAVQPS